MPRQALLARAFPATRQRSREAAPDLAVGHPPCVAFALDKGLTELRNRTQIQGKDSNLVQKGTGGRSVPIQTPRVPPVRLTGGVDVHCSVEGRRAPGERTQTGVKAAGTESVWGGRSCVIPARARRVWAGSMPRVNSMEPGGCPGVTVEVVLEVSGTLRRASSGQRCGGKGQDASRCAGY